MMLIDQLDAENISWEEFTAEVNDLHKDRIGVPSIRETAQNPRLEESFYSNPFPECICEKPCEVNALTV